MDEKKKILIIDDEKDFLELISIRLEDEGYEIYTESDGEQVLDQINKVKPDLVILDVVLVGSDGLTLLRKLKRESVNHISLKDIPVIVVTGKAVMMKEIFEVEGCDGFFNKPIDLKVLGKRIRELIGSDG